MELFYEQCFQKFSNICYFGYVVLILISILFLLNLYAFIKMTIYYRKFNFENTILLISTIQSSALVIEVIMYKKILVSIFLFFQIISMCLINFKFKKISKGFVEIKYNKVSRIVVIIDIVFLFIYLILSLTPAVKGEYIFQIPYYLLEIFSSFTLAYVCLIFLRLIKQFELNQKNAKNDDGKNDLKIDIKIEDEKNDTKNVTQKSDETKNDNPNNDDSKKDIPKSEDSKNDNTKNGDSTNDGTKNDGSISDVSKNGDSTNDDSKNGDLTNDEKIDSKNNPNFLKLNMVGNGLFYLIKKRQISLLYLGNIICSFLELILDIVVEIKTTLSYISYIYFLICLVHNSIIFISFYWLIRAQYKRKVLQVAENDMNEPIEKLIDNEFIEGEATNIKNENKKYSGFLYEDGKEKKDNTASELIDDVPKIGFTSETKALDFDDFGD